MIIWEQVVGTEKANLQWCIRIYYTCAQTCVQVPVQSQRRCWAPSSVTIHLLLRHCLSANPEPIITRLAGSWAPRTPFLSLHWQMLHTPTARQLSKGAGVPNTMNTLEVSPRPTDIFNITQGYPVDSRKKDKQKVRNKLTSWSSLSLGSQKGSHIRTPLWWVTCVCTTWPRQKWARLSLHRR